MKPDFFLDVFGSLSDKAIHRLNVKTFTSGSLTFEMFLPSLSKLALRCTGLSAYFSAKMQTITFTG
jgi:hypothetical protein